MLTSVYELVLLKPSASGSELTVGGLALMSVGLAVLENANTPAVLKFVSELIVLTMRVLIGELNTGGSVLGSSGEGVARMGGLDSELAIVGAAVKGEAAVLDAKTARAVPNPAAELLVVVEELLSEAKSNRPVVLKSAAASRIFVGHSSFQLPVHHHRLPFRKS